MHSYSFIKILRKLCSVYPYINLCYIPTVENNNISYNVTYVHFY